MIYCDHQIEKAIRDRRLMIDPLPDPSQFDSTSLNLRVGDDFLIWKEALQAKGTAHSIDLDNSFVPHSRQARELAEGQKNAGV